MPLEEEALFGKLLVTQGICTEEQVRECLALLQLELQGDALPRPSLGDILRKCGYLTPKGPVALGDSQLDDLPADARTAAQDRKNFAGKYLCVTQLGSGGMGEVWKAWEIAVRRWVALKVLKAEMADEAARFRREAETVAGLSHPNIAAVYEVGTHEGRPYIAMQFVQGETLATFARDDRRLLVELVHDAAIAVHYAHEKSVIHRDLKPQNLMVEGKRPAAPRAPGQGGHGLRIYVMDFGLAKQMSIASTHSGSDTIVGTPSYMSPEQAMAQSSRVSARSDVYSLGATLYELLLGRPPFRDSRLYDLIKKIVELPPEPPRSIVPDLDEDLEAVVLRCLEKDPARRYRTALELAADLRRWLDGVPILARPIAMVPIPQPPPRPAGVHIAVIAAALAVLFLAALGIRSALQGMPERTAQEREIDEILADIESMPSRDPDFERYAAGLESLGRAQRLARERAPAKGEAAAGAERKYRAAYEAEGKQRAEMLLRAAAEFAKAGEHREAARHLERFPRSLRQSGAWPPVEEEIRRLLSAVAGRPVQSGRGITSCPSAPAPAKGRWIDIAPSDCFRPAAPDESDDNWRHADGTLGGQSSPASGGKAERRDFLVLTYDAIADFELEFDAKVEGKALWAGGRVKIAGASASGVFVRIDPCADWTRVRLTLSGRTLTATVGDRAAEAKADAGTPAAGRIVFALGEETKAEVRRVKVMVR